MKSFLIKSFLFTLPIVLFVGIGLLLPSQKIMESFHHANAEKHQRISESSERQRLILVGGSNLSFGIYSPILEEAFDVKVINTGISGGYGLKFIMDDAIRFVREDDIVVLIPEYVHFYDNFYRGVGLPLLRGIDAYPANISVLDFRQFVEVTNAIPEHSLDKWKAMIKPKKNNSIYKSGMFNEYGDFVGHWEFEGAYNIGSTSIGERSVYNAEVAELIIDFADEVRSRKATILFSHSTFARSSYEKAEDRILELIEVFEGLEIPIAGDHASYVFEDSLFYDTHYHLRKEGQTLRTEHLVRDLKTVGIKGFLFAD